MADKERVTLFSGAIVERPYEKSGIGDGELLIFAAIALYVLWVLIWCIAFFPGLLAVYTLDQVCGVELSCAWTCVLGALVSCAIFGGICIKVRSMGGCLRACSGHTVKKDSIDEAQEATTGSQDSAWRRYLKDTAILYACLVVVSWLCFTVCETGLATDFAHRFWSLLEGLLGW